MAGFFASSTEASGSNDGGSVARISSSEWFAEMGIAQFVRHLISNRKMFCDVHKDIRS
jgi:hypothetical protein